MIEKSSTESTNTTLLMQAQGESSQGEVRAVLENTRVCTLKLSRTYLQYICLVCGSCRDIPSLGVLCLHLDISPYSITLPGCLFPLDNSTQSCYPSYLHIGELPTHRRQTRFCTFLRLGCQPPHVLRPTPWRSSPGQR